MVKTLRRNASAIAAGENLLGSWGDIIRRQGEESDRKQDLRIAQGTKALPGKVREMKAMDDDALVTYLVETRRSFSDPRETVLWDKLHVATRKEVMRRLKRTTP